MSITAKALAIAAGATVIALTGCASQQSGQATPQNLPNNCAAYAQAPAPSCKGYSQCKGHHHYGYKSTATRTTTVTTTATPPVASQSGSTQ